MPTRCCWATSTRWKNFLPFNRNLVFLDNTSPSVAVQELVNNATTLNFNALLVSDEQQAQRGAAAAGV